MMLNAAYFFDANFLSEEQKGKDTALPHDITYSHTEITYRYGNRHSDKL